MKKLIAILLILSTPAYADNAIKVKTGDIVQPTFDQGTLLDKEKAEKIKDQLIERDGFEKENLSYKKSVDLYEANKTIYQEENTLLLNRNIELTKTLNNSRQTNDWVKVGYFLLGVGVTGLAVYGAARLTK